MLNFIDIYICLPVSGCDGRGPSALLCPGAYNAVKTALVTCIDRLYGISINSFNVALSNFLIFSLEQSLLNNTNKNINIHVIQLYLFPLIASMFLFRIKPVC
jgi:hypothetical protein